MKRREEGAVSSVSLDPIRWLEPDDYSDLDICPERTFLLLTRAMDCLHPPIHLSSAYFAELPTG